MNPIAAIKQPHFVANAKPDTDDIGEVINNTIGQYLKQKRTTTMKEAAEDIGCDISYLSKIENDHVIPPWHLVQKLIDYYDIDIKLVPALAWKHLMQSRQDQFSLAVAFNGLSS